MFPVSAPYGPWSYLTGYFTLPEQEHKKVFPLKDVFVTLLSESGYFHIQGDFAEVEMINFDFSAIMLQKTINNPSPPSSPSSFPFFPVGGGVRNDCTQANVVGK